MAPEPTTLLASWTNAIVVTLAPGAVGGAANVLTGHPMDLVKVRLQTGTGTTTHNGAWSVLRSIVRTGGGIAGLYAGVAAPLAAVIPAFAVTFGTYETASRYLLQRPQSPSGQSQQQLSLSHVMLAGGCAGLTLGLVLGPFERIKCLLQVQKPSAAKGKTATNDGSMRTMVQQCYATGGLRSVFRGTGLTVAREVPGNVTYFGVYEGVRRALLLQQQSTQPSVPTWAITLFAGGTAGVVNWIVAIPIDVIKSRWQTNDAYPTVQACVRELLATEGPAGFLRGLRPALLRAFPANAATFGGVAATKTWLETAGYEV